LVVCYIPHVIEKQTLVSFNISSPSTCFFHCILTVNLNLCTCIYVDSKDALIKICDYAYVSATCYHHLRKKNQFHKNVYCSWIYNYLCNQCLSPIVAVSFNGGGNSSTQRKPLTCRKSLTNFITSCCIKNTSPEQDSNSQH
jgi:hypothetical protein